MFLVNSRLDLIIATFLKVPLLPKLRGYFAEFLRESCLAPLSILYQSTCVGLGTGLFNSLEDFLGKKVLLTQQTMVG